MTFIGMIIDNKEFEMIKSELIKNIKEEKLNIINITKQNIQNMQNIKFETIVIGNKLEKLKEEKETLNKICENTKYLLLNSDLEQTRDLLKGEETTVITYGLNQKATVTVSSVTEEKVLIALQRNLKNKKGEVIEVEEKEIEMPKNKKIYEGLIEYSITTLYEKNNR